jgi:Na+-driven multidrug efflux pump
MLIALVNMGMNITDTAMVAAMLGAEALASVAVGEDRPRAAISEI